MAKSRHDSVARRLVSRPEIQVKALNYKVKTPPVAATCRGYEIPVKRLLVCGADVNYWIETGDTILRLAASYDYDSVITCGRNDIVWLDFPFLCGGSCAPLIT